MARATGERQFGGFLFERVASVLHLGVLALRAAGLR